jgi:hypothetical protein
MFDTFYVYFPDLIVTVASTFYLLPPGAREALNTRSKKPGERPQGFPAVFFLRIPVGKTPVREVSGIFMREIKKHVTHMLFYIF